LLLPKGVKAAKNEILLFGDADLINLKPHHLSSLIWPLARDRAGMSIGDWSSGFRPQLNLITSPLLWYFSGQRCLKKKFIFPYLKKIAKSEYGIEIILNEIFKSKRVVVVPWVSNKKPSSGQKKRNGMTEG
jgi:hypothetical protein